ncbi:CoA pyrophosphatase [uncultured Vibrio sp.]|uniref:CoA pyrophosphatase n=1 Tax=uncultured Vibrio sp. TaxID=114054 RepID=UPI00091CFEF3|nr:CoA pyrophosphatase [uncultured Vibrio sp.]OIQ26607.1 MAG: coenzyme A pyrophosphatase [Vibrio sp. MedPE-SWchi]
MIQTYSFYKLLSEGNALFELNKSDLIQKFQFHQPVSYHAESTKRVSHLENNALRKASVLVGFIERPQGLSVVLTKRAKHLRHHPGQISFPGGKYEESDTSILYTAIRETHEEVGIDPKYISIFGQMPELVTVSHFSVTPVLAFIDPDYSMSIDPNEVDEVFEIPVSHLLDEHQLFSHLFTINHHHHHRVFALPYKHHFIWGMTAQIIQAMQQHIMATN